ATLPNKPRLQGSLPQAPASAPAIHRSVSHSQIDRTALRQALNSACEWMRNVAQVQTDTLTIERNTPKLQHRHWRGALRGEYRVWHTSQAIKSFVWASHALNRPELLDAALLGGEFIGAERVTDRSDQHYGLIYAFEDFGNTASTSAVLEALDGLWVLAEATGDNRYAEWANAAAAWEARNSYMGDGLFRDRFDITTGRIVLPS